jgi:hypothetical protein
VLPFYQEFRQKLPLKKESHKIMINSALREEIYTRINPKLLFGWQEFRCSKDQVILRLKDFWWVGHSIHGRSGHSYTCPLLMTLNIWKMRLKGIPASWIASYPNWLEADGDLYSPASAVYQPIGQSHFVEVRNSFPAWMVGVELGLRGLQSRGSFNRLHSLFSFLKP